MHRSLSVRLSPWFGKTKRWLNPVFQALIVLAVAGGYFALRWVVGLPETVDDQQTIVVGQTRFAPASDASVRVVVQDRTTEAPIPDARVTVSLVPEKGRAIRLFEGKTDATGSLPVSFRVPDTVSSQAKLVVEARSSIGRDRVEQQVTIEHNYRLLLSSDKPLYQPGQLIQMRVLALSAFDMSPARGTTVAFLVEDPRGNKVFRKNVTTSEFGVAAVDFRLADMVNQGEYKLSVSVVDSAGGMADDSRAEKTVEVRPYVLPKFAVDVSTDRTYYLPGQRVEGTVRAEYFFGKPVALGQVQIVGTVWDVGRVEVVDLHGQTDENGAFAFGFDLPEYFAGSGLEVGQARFALEVTVVDQTEHAEQTSHVLPVAAQPLIVEAVAESGVLKPGVENVVYLLTSYPDGRPAPAQLKVVVDNGSPVELTSGSYGLAEFTFTPVSGGSHLLTVTARDETGAWAGREFSLEAERGGDSVLLRADRAAYVVGETMHLVALTPVGSGSVYLDIVKAGQTLSTRSLPVVEGKAEFAIDVSAEMYGTLELHAYKVLLDGTVVRDTRLVVVDAPNDLSIAIDADRETYLPGDTATITFVTSRAGHDVTGVQTALGLAIVDESVFALQQQDPGFAKLYFLLEQELLEPFYQVQGFELPAQTPPGEQSVREAQDAAAKATWASWPVAASQATNSHPEKVDAAYLAQEVGLERIGRTSAIALVLIPVVMGVAAVVSARSEGTLRDALRRLALALGVIVLLGGGLIGLLRGMEGDLYYTDFDTVLFPLAVIGGIGALIMLAYAWAKRYLAAQVLAVLTLAWGGLLFLLFRSLDEGASPPSPLVLAALWTYLVIPLAYLLFGQGYLLRARRFAGALATGFGVVALLPAVLVFAAVPASSLDAGRHAVERLETGHNEVRLGLKNGEMDEFWADAALPEVGFEGGVAQSAIREESTPAPPGEPAPTAEPPRLRQFFPETLYWAPEVVTDENGFISLDIPMADSITTWRLTALASSQDGRLGFTTRGIRVFQDFFVDIDLPLALTQGDEISIPVGVFNYLPQAQDVRLVVEQDSWFELLGPAEQTLTIASNDIEVVYFPIRVLEFGQQQGFQVTAWGEKMSDAIRREVRVLPDGKEIRLTESGWLNETREVGIEIPIETVPGTPYVEVKIYPGVMAQAVEGLEKILRLPHG